jgi:hypothetical protein
MLPPGRQCNYQHPSCPGPAYQRSLGETLRHPSEQTLCGLAGPRHAASGERDRACGRQVIHDERVLCAMHLRGRTTSGAEYHDMSEQLGGRNCCSIAPNGTMDKSTCRTKLDSMTHYIHLGVDSMKFSEALLSELIRSFGIGPDRIAIRFDMEPVDLQIDIAVPGGPLVNELITSALEHAFPGRDHGEIRTALTQELGNEVLLSVSDVRIGLPSHADISSNETIGLQLADLLVTRFEGEISIRRSDRFNSRYDFKSDDRPEVL